VFIHQIVLFHDKIKIQGNFEEEKRKNIIHTKRKFHIILSKIANCEYI